MWWCGLFAMLGQLCVSSNLERTVRTRQHCGHWVFGLAIPHGQLLPFREVRGDAGVRWLITCVVALVSLLPACSKTSDSDRLPYGTRENARLAAEECGIKTWYWGKAIPMHGPESEHPSFAFDPELDSDGKSNEANLSKIYDCLDASFARQKVRINLAGAA